MTDTTLATWTWDFKVEVYSRGFMDCRIVVSLSGSDFPPHEVLVPRTPDTTDIGDAIDTALREWDRLAKETQ